MKTTGWWRCWACLEVELLPDVRADDLVVLLAVVTENLLLGAMLRSTVSSMGGRGQGGGGGRTQASMLAPDSQFGSASIEITLCSYKDHVSSRVQGQGLRWGWAYDRRIFSTDWTGLQRSLDDSYAFGSSPGACRMEMHTSPEA